jgi:hypothetical protein
MRLGPVNHQQFGLPSAISIENFHQGSKCFTEELDNNGHPSELFISNRLSFYQDPVPHRHKYKGTIPAFFVWIDKDGKEYHLNYVDSRQFYCYFYEILATQTNDYQHLKKLVESGTNMEICGYDAHPLAPDETIEDAYLDTSKPFGHERVLFALLTLTPEHYPWRTHGTLIPVAK